MTCHAISAQSYDDIIGHDDTACLHHLARREILSWMHEAPPTTLQRLGAVVTAAVHLLVYVYL